MEDDFRRFQSRGPVQPANATPSADDTPRRLSFVLSMIWLLRSGWGRVEQAHPTAPTSSLATFDRLKRRERAAHKAAGMKTAKTRQRTAIVVDQPSSWRLSLFRILLYVAFCMLSLQATRNSHQFAAVVGAVTAWNFGEWAAAIRRRRITLIGEVPSVATNAVPRLVAFGALFLADFVGRLRPLLQADRRGAA